MANIKKIVTKYNNDIKNILDMLHEVQAADRSISEKSISELASSLKVSDVDIRGIVTFYHFFSEKSAGKYTVYLNNNPVAYMNGRKKIAKAFEKALGIKFGNVSKDNLIGLFDTSCIGMNDQEPAAIINKKIFTKLTPAKVKKLVQLMQEKQSINNIVKSYYSNSDSADMLSLITNKFVNKGPILMDKYTPGAGLVEAIKQEPSFVIKEVKNSKIRGRGGAGFPTGMKWEMCANIKSTKKYIFCNADEGEPGTFKDRALLTRFPQMIFEGMAIAGYAVGAQEGFVYLRGEYDYLREYLNNVITEMKANKLLGKNILGKKGFNFDISIKLGAGAYICGAETALIESAEGKRGVPRNRPPFPIQKGYLDQPTIVNNVETLMSITKILERGSNWFKKLGIDQSTGTKFLSISGDCEKPGIYEFELGVSVKEILKLCGGTKAQAVQIGGPSGKNIHKGDFKGLVHFDELATGGSMIIIGPDRDLLEVINNFNDFFIAESCGWCTPCRVGNILLSKTLNKIRNGKGVPADLETIEKIALTMQKSSRCGLGQTSANPVYTSLISFRGLFEKLINQKLEYNSEFDLKTAYAQSAKFTKRKDVAGV